MWAWPAGALKSLIVKAKLHKALNANASYEQQTMWQLPYRQTERERVREKGGFELGLMGLGWVGFALLLAGSFYTLALPAPSAAAVASVQ